MFPTHIWSNQSIPPNEIHSSGFRLNLYGIRSKFINILKFSSKIIFDSSIASLLSTGEVKNFIWYSEPHYLCAAECLRKEKLHFKIDFSDNLLTLIVFQVWVWIKYWTKLWAWKRYYRQLLFIKLDTPSKVVWYL